MRPLSRACEGETPAADSGGRAGLPPRRGLMFRIPVVFSGTAMIWLLIVYLNSEVLTGGSPVAVRLFNAAFTCVLGVGLVVAARRLLDRRPLEGLGIALNRRAWLPLAVGIGAFAIPSTVGLSIASAAGWVRLTPTVPITELAGSVLLLVVTVFLYEALPEELIFRGYLYRNLTTVTAPWRAALLQAALFAVFGTSLWVLTSGWGVLIARGTIFLCMGTVLGLIRLVSGSVWACIGFHLGFQVVAQAILGASVATEGPVEVFGILPSFVLGTVLVATFLRVPANWTRVEPDLS